MVLRLSLLFLGLLLFGGGVAYALEPVRSSLSIDDMMNGARPGAVVKPHTKLQQASFQESKASQKPLPVSSAKQTAPLPNHSSAIKPKNLIAMPAQKLNTNVERIITASPVKPVRVQPTWHGKPLTGPVKAGQRPPVTAKALFCLDCTSNKIVLAENTCTPLPIASISKLVTAMVVVEKMDLDKVVEVPDDIGQVERHVVGLKPGDQLTVRDLLHGLLIESGNDCAETLARAYPKGAREGFIAAMNAKAKALGASTMSFHTPSGLDSKMTLGRKDGQYLEARKANSASAEDVAKIARAAFRNPLISRISSTRTHTMRTRNYTPRDYPLVSNDKLLTKNLPIVGAKTGYTNLAGKCIVALFKDKEKEHMVVVLNSPNHFKAAEKVYRWAQKPM